MRLVRNLDLVSLAGIVAMFWEPGAFTSRLDLLAALLLVPVHGSLLQYYGLYESHRVEGAGLLLRNLLSASTTSLLLFFLLLPFLAFPHWQFVLSFVGVSFAVILLERLLLMATLRMLRSRGYDLRRVCVIGPTVEAQALSDKFTRNPAWGMKTFYRGDPQADGSVLFRGETGDALGNDLEHLLRSETVDEVLIFTRPEDLDAQRPLLTLCKDHGVTGRLVLRPATAVEVPDGPQIEDFLGAASFAVHAEQLGAAALACKRVMDIVLSALLLIGCAPAMVTIAILIKVSSPGPVLFRQRRVGRGGRHFTTLKFRTMVDGAEGLLPSLAARNITDGPAFKTRDDWRVTPAGRWLRRYSLDELPQLFNVLAGDMSLVGPRPLPVHEARGVERAYRRRFVMRPGLTCFWQVSGRSDIAFAAWMRMDLDYVDGWSLWLDTKLLFRTVPAVLSGRGAY